jgi:hypothetical protein
VGGRVAFRQSNRAAQRPAAFLPDLATSLDNLGSRLGELSRHDEALQATAEAVQLTMPLVEKYPRAFVSELRRRLQNSRRRCEELSQDPDADPLVRQAEELLARLDATSGQ